MPCVVKATYLYGTRNRPLGMLTFGITSDRLIVNFRYMAPDWVPDDVPAVQERQRSYDIMDGRDPEPRSIHMHSWGKYMASGIADIMEKSIAAFSEPPSGNAR